MSEKKAREWDIKSAKAILDDYKKPSENIDIGNVYYAATQLEAALTDCEARLSGLTKLYGNLQDTNATLRSKLDAANAMIAMQASGSVTLTALDDAVKERDELRAELNNRHLREDERIEIHAEIEELRAQLRDYETALEKIENLQWKNAVPNLEMTADMRKIARDVLQIHSAKEGE